MAQPDKTYKALQKIYIGDSGEHTEVGELIVYNGKTVTKANGTEVDLKYPNAINAAIKAGWFVPEDSPETSFRPRAAGVEIHKAVSTSEKREAVKMPVVVDEERDVGSIGSVRTAANDGRGEVPDTHVAGNAGQVRQPTGAMPVVRDGDDGRVVGRIKSSAVAAPIEVGKDDLKAKSQADTRKTFEVERYGTEVRSATGDVQVARTGDDLEDLLPDAATSGTPVFVNAGVEVGNAGSSIGGADDGRVVGKVGGSPATPEADPGPALADAEGALRAFVNGGPAPHPSHLKGLLRTFLRKYDAAKAQASVIAEEKASEEKASGQPVPEAEIEWDLSRHWKVREGDALRDFGHNPDALRQILAVEPSAGVKKAIQKRLGELGA